MESLEYGGVPLRSGHFLILGGTFPGSSTIRIFNFSFQGVFSWAALRSKSSFPHSRGYFPGELYDSNLHFLIPGGIFPGGSTILFTSRGYPGHSKSSFPHSRGYFPGQLYDSYLHFLILGGIFPGNSTIQIFISSFQGVLSQAALRFISSFPHSRGYFPGRLYDLNHQLLIPGGTLPGGSTIQIFISSFQGVFSRAALRFKSSFPHSRGYFPRWLYDSN